MAVKAKKSMQVVHVSMMQCYHKLRAEGFAL